MKEEIQYLQKLLQEAYDHYFDNSDGYHKSSEALIEVTFRMGNLWDDVFGKGEADWYNIMIYSYVLGPNRSHDFSGNTFDEAYKKAKKAVEEWHKKEMEHDYSKDNLSLLLFQA